MHRIIKVAAVATASLIGFGATSAHAAVNYSGAGIGHVDKGDVQSALKWNNGDFDKGAADLKFTAGTQVMGNQTRWQCSGGEQSQTSLVTQKLNVTTKTLYSSNGKQITGWDLTGLRYDYVSGQRVGASYVGYCPAGEWFVGFLPNVFTTDIHDGGLKVNNVDLPNTPVVAPV